MLKNAVDWASRPADSSVLRRKPVALMSGAPGAFGGVRAQLSLRQSLLWTDSDVVTKPEVMVFAVRQRFDEDGNLVDEAVEALLRRLVDALADKIRQRHPMPV